MFKHRRLVKALKPFGLMPVNIIGPLLRVKGISQAEIAKQLDVSQSYISQVINNKKDRPDIRETIVSILDFDPWR